jgi:hypothetical protein
MKRLPLFEDFNNRKRPEGVNLDKYNTKDIKRSLVKIDGMSEPKGLEKFIMFSAVDSEAEQDVIKRYNEFIGFINDSKLIDEFDKAFGCRPNNFVLWATNQHIRKTPDWLPDVARPKERKLLAKGDRLSMFLNVSDGFTNTGVKAIRTKKSELNKRLESMVGWAKYYGVTLQYDHGSTKILNQGNSGVKVSVSYNGSGDLYGLSIYYDTVV